MTIFNQLQNLYQRYLENFSIQILNLNLIKILFRRLNEDLHKPPTIGHMTSNQSVDTFDISEFILLH